MSKIAIFIMIFLLEITVVGLLLFRRDEDKYTAFLHLVIFRANRFDCRLK